MPGLDLNQTKECTEEMDAKGRSIWSRNKVEATGKALRHERRQQQTGTQSGQGSCER